MRKKLLKYKKTFPIGKTNNVLLTYLYNLKTDINQNISLFKN